MPVTVILQNEPKPYYDFHSEASDLNIIRRACPDSIAEEDIEVLEGTWKDLTDNDNIIASSSGFLGGVLEAYTKRLHLVLRPDEVWMTILTQLRFYIERNAGTVQYIFVPFTEQKEVILDNLDTNHISEKLQDTLQKCARRPWMAEWISPNFSTTTPGDCITANCIMTGAMGTDIIEDPLWQMCGIPSFTLLGEADDWQKLVGKLVPLELACFGDEPAEWAASLRAVLNNVIFSFDDPTRPDVKEFWGAIVRAYQTDTCRGPGIEVGGWITEFFKWDKYGDPIQVPRSPLSMMKYSDEDVGAFPPVDIRSLPVGYVTLPIRLIDTEQHLVAGSMAKRIVPEAPEGYYEALDQMDRVTADPPGLSPHLASYWDTQCYAQDTNGNNCPLKALVERFKRRQARLNGRVESPPLKKARLVKVALRDRKVTVVREFKIEVERQMNNDDIPSIDLQLPETTIWDDLLPLKEDGGGGGPFGCWPHSTSPFSSRGMHSLESESSSRGGWDMASNDGDGACAFDGLSTATTEAATLSRDSSIGLKLAAPAGVLNWPQVERVRNGLSGTQRHATLEPLSGWMLFGTKNGHYSSLCEEGRIRHEVNHEVQADARESGGWPLFCGSGDTGDSEKRRQWDKWEYQGRQTMMLACTR